MIIATPRPLYPLEWPGTQCTGGRVDTRAGLDGCGKSFPHRDSIPQISSALRVAVPTVLLRPTWDVRVHSYVTAGYVRLCLFNSLVVMQYVFVCLIADRPGGNQAGRVCLLFFFVTFKGATVARSV